MRKTDGYMEDREEFRNRGDPEPIDLQELALIQNVLRSKIKGKSSKSYDVMTHSIVTQAHLSNGSDKHYGMRSLYDFSLEDPSEPYNQALKEILESIYKFNPKNDEARDSGIGSKK